MSYSFQVKAANKPAAKAAVAAEFDKVVQSQPVHSRDKAQALANANAVIDLLGEDDSKDVSVSCNGYVRWSSGDGDTASLTTASISATANHVQRVAAE
jgi:hypothetical protein